MKFRNLAALICGVMILSSSLCFAAVDGGKIALGGIMPGMSESDLIAAFGQPTYRDGEDWTYQTFNVEVERGRRARWAIGGHFEFDIWYG